jgi:CMP/dCMP kinase
VTSRTKPVVAIDGPAGAGKSTVTRRVAAELGYLLVDTGAIYRTVALAVQEKVIPFDETARVIEVAEQLARENLIRFVPDGIGGQRVLLGTQDVSDSIRTPQIGQSASKVSAIPAVREALLEMQRSAGQNGGVVLEGRDIGTVVFPDAEAKFFLTATVEERAGRRLRELVSRGEDVDFESVKREVMERDRRDSTRAVAPLAQATDAIVVDSSGVPIDEVVARIVARVREVEAELRA